MCEMDMEHFTNPNLSVVVCEILVFRVCGARQNLYMFGLYHNQDLEDWIYEFINSNGCRAGSGCAFLVPAYG